MRLVSLLFDHRNASLGRFNNRRVMLSLFDCGEQMGDSLERVVGGLNQTDSLGSIRIDVIKQSVLDV